MTRTRFISSVAAILLLALPPGGSGQNPAADGSAPKLADVGVAADEENAATESGPAPGATDADADADAEAEVGSATPESADGFPGPAPIGALATAVYRIVDTDTGRAVALATALGPEAVLVTKASLLEDLPHLAMLDSLARRTPIREVRVDRKNDLALLVPETPPGASVRLPAPGELPNDPALGTIVQGIVGADLAPRIGVIAARTRSIEQRNGVMGVRLSPLVPPQGGVAIEAVMEDGAAEEAGLREGDRILAVDGRQVGNTREIRRIVFDHPPGDEITLRIGRENGDEVEVPLRLGYQTDTFDKLDRNMIMSGETSRRKTGFERAFQHDVEISPTEAGSPLFDLEGRLLGINIARYDRVTVFALPLDVVLASLERIRKPESGSEETQPTSAEPRRAPDDTGVPH